MSTIVSEYKPSEEMVCPIHSKTSSGHKVMVSFICSGAVTNNDRSIMLSQPLAAVNCNSPKYSSIKENPPISKTCPSQMTSSIIVDSIRSKYPKSKQYISKHPWTPKMVSHYKPASLYVPLFQSKASPTHNTVSIVNTLVSGSTINEIKMVSIQPSASVAIACRF